MKYIRPQLLYDMYANNGSHIDLTLNQMKAIAHMTGTQRQEDLYDSLTNQSLLLQKEPVFAKRHMD